MKFCFFLARLECLSLFASSEVDYKLQQQHRRLLLILWENWAPSAATSSFAQNWSRFCSGVLETFCQMCGEEKQTPLSPRQQLWKVCSLGKSQMNHFNFDSGGIWKSWRHVYNISTDGLIIHVSWSTRGTPFVVSKCEMLRYIPLQDVCSDSGF